MEKAALPPEEEKGSVRINVHVLSSLVAVIAAFVVGIAWGVRLEDKTDQNAKKSDENTARIVALESTSHELDKHLVAVDSKLDAIKNGIDELKKK